jgi:outer membrane beta-barrel protein
VENWFRSIFLAVALMPVAELAAQSDEEDSGNLIEPQIERVEFDESKIDSQDFEIAAYVGFLAIENFNTDIVVGIKLGYHISEDFFVQASYGTSDAGETSFEKLSGGAPLLTEEERQLEYYLVSLGFNLLPGEAFLSDATTYNTVFYLTGGVGTTTFAGEDRFTIEYGAGYRVLFADNLSIDVEMRNLVFNMDIFGSVESTNNLEFTVGLNLFF